MVYILKHFDTPLIWFSLESKGLEGISCKILEQDFEKTELLPIGMQKSEGALLSFLRSRAVPKGRGYIEAILSSMGLRENNLMGILDTCMALSLNDGYWVTKEGFEGKFSEYNLYDNDFSKPLSLIAYMGYGSIKKRGFTSSPEFTTTGMLRKGWRKISGKTLLYKGGTEGASNAGNEPYSEYYASQVARAMGLRYIEYTLAKWKGSVCSVCELFTDKATSYVPVYRFGEFDNILQIAAFLKDCGKDYYDDFADMMIFDALIYNTDRHQGNFGLLVDAATNKPVSLAPIFDNGLGLFPYAVGNTLDDIKNYAKTKDSAFGVPFDDIAKEFITKRHCEKLRKILNFRFERDKNYNLPAARLKFLEGFLHFRAAELINISRQQ